MGDRVKRVDGGGENGSRACAAAIDLGASSGRVIVGVYDAHEGLTLHEVHRFENGLADADGHLVWDIGRLINEVRHGLSLAAEMGATTCGIDTWGVDYGLIDAAGELCGDVVGYRDARTEGVAKRLKDAHEYADTYARTGVPFLDINTLSQVMAQMEEEGPFADGVRILTVPDLVTFMLTGACGTEASIASTTQLMGAMTRQWDTSVLGRVGLTPASMPPIERLGADVGMIPDEVAAGMRMVRVCEHDTASAVASVELLPGDVFISCGTWSLVGIELRGPILTKEAEASGLSNEAGPDGSTLLLSNCTGLWIAQQLKLEIEREMGIEMSWEEIAAAVSSMNEPSFVFDTEDSRLAQPGCMLAKLREMATDAGYEGCLGVPELFRAVYESLAVRYRVVIAMLREVANVHCERIRIIGGGSRNSVLCQLVADACGKPVVAGPHEASAMGNLLVQMTAQGVFGSLDEARKVAAASEEQISYTPRQPKEDIKEREASC